MTVMSARAKLLLVAALFFAPIVVALLLYFVFPQWQPAGKVHHGVLVDPARPVPALAFTALDGTARDQTVLRGKWSFVYLGAADCAQSCQDRLFQIRQIRTLLNEKRLRVQRVYVAPDGEALARAEALLRPAHPDLVVLAGGSGLRAFFGPDEEHTLYLVDPLGNWLMAYPPSTDSPGILKDIKKLLRISQIG